MLKMPESVKELELNAAGALKELLEQVPTLKLSRIEAEPHQRHADFVAELDVDGKRHLLVCEVKASGQPRNVRMALHQLREAVGSLAGDATPVFIAPYLSPESQALCREAGASYLDLHGNALIVFGGVFIDRQVAGKPATEKRELRSLFKPKSAQVLRMMLREPRRPWRVTELAEAADVSLGHVSNVRSGLLARDWGEVSDEGLFLSAPDALLDAWRESYEGPAGRRTSLYTPLHGRVLEDALRRALYRSPESGNAILSSFSAAQWIAPYGRTGLQHFYADRAGWEQLSEHLKLSPVVKGENVVVIVPKDDGVFRDTIEPAPGIICTSEVQTYLDLSAAGERGQEAAEHLRREKLKWQS